LPCIINVQNSYVYRVAHQPISVDDDSEKLLIPKFYSILKPESEIDSARDRTADRLEIRGTNNTEPSINSVFFVRDKKFSCRERSDALAHDECTRWTGPTMQKFD